MFPVSVFVVGESVSGLFRGVSSQGLVHGVWCRAVIPAIFGDHVGFKE